jgi:hypothetical protein
MDRLGSNVMAQYIPYRWQIFDGEREYGFQGPLDSLFHTKNMILPNQNCDVYNSYSMEIKAVSDHFQNFVCQFRGLYVTRCGPRCGPWVLNQLALNFAGLFLGYIPMRRSRVTIYLGHNFGFTSP